MPAGSATVMLVLLPDTLQVPPPLEASTVYHRIALPPFAGTVQLTVARPRPPTPVTASGAAGTVAFPPVEGVGVGVCVGVGVGEVDGVGVPPEREGVGVGVAPEDVPPLPPPPAGVAEDPDEPALVELAEGCWLGEECVPLVEPVDEVPA